ncbi:MAG: restriction endonuclease subunit S [Gammaproteobacteria bacterium]|jgi:type I restriction enzyme, S subunit|nr:restriction endonuclease subunit S [Gammaproteobacteria bacterium]MBT3488664.1 restriction endonuclease subunit S [Gammaproteobacteria bacterium]MBT3717517.1 restriction endonuclease subunit S [Gammaproteobacteria bacterium]MBT3844705.1 restriction endonuclease subunit S [Gammaproteobacteria bacterium]MBT3892609.1 restriction endonuclease subunit S [Gammaproteobacteria bacterium]
MKRKYRGYPEYQGSRVAWMGDVPDHWEPVRFKQVLAEKKKNCNPELSAGSISFGNVIYKSSENLLPETKASYQEVLAGEFLINPLNMNYDLLSLRTALSSIDVVVSTGYIVLQSNGRLLKRYTRWLLQEFDVAHMKTLGSGVRQTISYADIGNSFFFEPSKEEQENIANFLDHETAKIDILIEKQQQLIKLLKEKRQAVISHAVTKGLNPNAPMCDSGVEWLGEVPEHWDVMPVRRVIDKIQQGNSPVADNRPPSIEENGVLKISAVKYGHFNEMESKTLETPIDSRFIVKKRDLLVTRANTPKLVADACYVESEPTRNIMLCDLIYRLNTNYKIDNEYLCQCLLSDKGRFQIELDARGSSMTMAKVSQEHIKNWVFPVPPVSEQINIIKYIRKRALDLGVTLSKAEKTIELLKERRTALISAAVTGKIDVREWQAPQQPYKEEAA